MEKLLASIGIQEYNSFIYEYESVRIDWWDVDEKVSLEIEVHQHDDLQSELSVVFCLDTEGIAERTVVFYALFENAKLIDKAFVAKRVCTALGFESNFQFSEDQNAFIIESYEDAISILSKILDLLSNKEPLLVNDLKDKEESERSDIYFEVGDTLEHFIAMLAVNSDDINQGSIENVMELASLYEGNEYLEDLKRDVNSEIEKQRDFDISANDLNLVKKTIKNYTIKESK
ncbi:hypothetical protein [Aureibacter tunicatorum]|uniref:Uncharacterized protein n=1 Tax=Aureibacter tunicatorum TaxID=866807 RepID=A0AAE4BUC1_9BACT|nr:hypothetical protein [Aureibacter tunicatorum]MDR6240613.1 hypothetical protein [Aureibacter tunicatorum]